MSANEPRLIAKRIFAMIAACTLGLGVTSAYGDDAPAQHYPAALVQVAELERAFWICDYTATTRGLDATPVDVCVAVTDGLKDEKFGGDFLALLSWWQQNKFVEHAKLEGVIGEFGTDNGFLLRRGSDAPANASDV